MARIRSARNQETQVEIMKAKVFSLGKSQYAVCKPGDFYLVYRLVRRKWQHIESHKTWAEACLCIFRMAAVKKDDVTI